MLSFSSTIFVGIYRSQTCSVFTAHRGVASHPPSRRSTVISVATQGETQPPVVFPGSIRVRETGKELIEKSRGLESAMSTSNTYNTDRHARLPEFYIRYETRGGERERHVCNLLIITTTIYNFETHLSVSDIVCASLLGDQKS